MTSPLLSPSTPTSPTGSVTIPTSTVDTITTALACEPEFQGTLRHPRSRDSSLDTDREHQRARVGSPTLPQQDTTQPPPSSGRGTANPSARLGIHTVPNARDIHLEQQIGGIGGCPVHSINHLFQDSLLRVSEMPAATLDQTARRIERLGGVTMHTHVDLSFQGTLDEDLEQHLEHVGAMLFEIGDTSDPAARTHQITMIRWSDRNPGVQPGGVWVALESGIPSLDQGPRLDEFRTVREALSHVAGLNGVLNPDEQGNPQSILVMAYPSAVLRPQHNGRGAYIAGQGFVLQQNLTASERALLQVVHNGVQLQASSRTSAHPLTQYDVDQQALNSAPLLNLHKLARSLNARHAMPVDADAGLLLELHEDNVRARDRDTLVELLAVHFPDGVMPLTTEEVALLPAGAASPLGPLPGTAQAGVEVTIDVEALGQMEAPELRTLMQSLVRRMQVELPDPLQAVLQAPREPDDDTSELTLLFTELFPDGRVSLQADELEALSPPVRELVGQPASAEASSETPVCSVPSDLPDDTVGRVREPEQPRPDARRERRPGAGRPTTQTLSPPNEALFQQFRSQLRQAYLRLEQGSAPEAPQRLSLLQARSLTEHASFVRRFMSVAALAVQAICPDAGSNMQTWPAHERAIEFLGDFERTYRRSHNVPSDILQRFITFLSTGTLPTDGLQSRTPQKAPPGQFIFLPFN